MLKLVYDRDRDNYRGYHQFMQQSYNGYMIFEVYNRNGQWFWSEFDDYSGSHVGFEEGPFETSREAYYNAMGFSHATC